jgi:membrane protein DedA with SNARE-associated domain
VRSHKHAEHKMTQGFRRMHTIDKRMILSLEGGIFEMLTSQANSLLAAGLLCCLAYSAASSSMTLSAALAPATPGQDASAGSDSHQSAAVRHFRGSLARVHLLLRRYGYWAAAATTLAEGVGIPMPGQSLLIAGAVEAAEGRMNIAGLLLLVTASAIMGNSLGYAIGYWGGRFVLNKLKVNSQRQQHLEELFKRRGGFVILFGRFVDGLRQLNGILSGTMKMPWWSFTAYNIAGALLWTATWGLGSYYLGRKIHFIAGFFYHHHAWLFVLGLTALLALLVHLSRSTRRNAHGQI